MKVMVAASTKVEADARAIAITAVVAMPRTDPLAIAPIAAMANLLGGRGTLFLRGGGVAGQCTGRCGLHGHRQEARALRLRSLKQTNGTVFI